MQCIENFCLHKWTYSYTIHTASQYKDTLLLFLLKKYIFHVYFIAVVAIHLTKQ